MIFWIMLNSVQNWQWYSAIFCRVFNIHLISIIWRKKAQSAFYSKAPIGAKIVPFLKCWHQRCAQKVKVTFAKCQMMFNCDKTMMGKSEGKFQLSWTPPTHSFTIFNSDQLVKILCNNKWVKHVFWVKCVVSMFFLWVCAFNFF